MMIIYYAHPMSWYGTDSEKADVAFLSQFGTVENPNGLDWEFQVSQAIKHGYPIMQVFADYIRNLADVVAYRPFYDGKLGAGVAREVLEAQIWGKEVWRLVGYEADLTGVIKKPDLTRNPILTVAETCDRITRKVM